MLKEKGKAENSRENVKKTLPRFKRKLFAKERLDVELEEPQEGTQASLEYGKVVIGNEERINFLKQEAEKKYAVSRMKEYKFPGRFTNDVSQESSLGSLINVETYKLSSQNLKHEANLLAEKLQKLDLTKLTKKRNIPLNSDRNRIPKNSICKSPENCQTSRERDNAVNRQRDHTHTLSDLKTFKHPFLREFLKRINLKKDHERLIFPSKTNIKSSQHSKLISNGVKLDFGKPVHPSVSRTKKNSKEPRSRSKELKTKKGKLSKCLGVSRASMQIVNPPTLSKGTSGLFLLQKSRHTQNPFATCRHGAPTAPLFTDRQVNLGTSRSICGFVQHLRKKEDGLITNADHIRLSPSPPLRLPSKKKIKQQKTLKEPAQKSKEYRPKNFSPQVRGSARISAVPRLTLGQNRGYLDFDDRPLTDRQPRFDRMNFI